MASKFPPPVLRVVAIGVQGLMNRSPGKSASFLTRDQGDWASTFPRPIEVSIFEHVVNDGRFGEAEYWKRPIKEAFVVFLQKQIDVEEGALKLAYIFQDREWRDIRGLGAEDFDRWPRRTQKEVEALVAKLYTAPDLVEHVTNEALRTAATLWAPPYRGGR